jgi:hypothetical protein
MAKSKSNSKAAAAAKKPAGQRSTAARKQRSPKRREPEREPAGAKGPGSQTKQALVIGLLQRESGATLDDLVAATGWLPHTTRAALTRLRQSGFMVDKSKDEVGRTVYRIASAPAAPSRKVA